jgi:hypothetical protein
MKYRVSRIIYPFKKNDQESKPKLVIVELLSCARWHTKKAMTQHHPSLRYHWILLGPKAMHGVDGERMTA